MRTRTNLPVILDTIKNKLIAEGVYNATTVFLADTADEIKVPPSTSYCIVVPGDQETEDQETDLVSGTIEVHLRHELQLDSATRSDIQLSGSTGILVKRLAVHGCLHQKDLVIGLQGILAEPMRLLRFTSVTTENGWGKMMMTFSVKYGLDVSVEVPAASCSSDDSFSCEYDYEFGSGISGRAFSSGFSNAFG